MKKTTEEITKKINEMMEEELKEASRCNAASKWWKNKGKPEYEEDMKTATKQHLSGYARLSEVLEYINEK